jgi:hypothetical protein
LSALCVGHFLPPGIFLLLISVKGWFNPRAIVQLKGLGKLKNPMTWAEPLCLNQLYYCLPDNIFLQRLKMWLFMRYGELSVTFLKPWLKLCCVRNSAYVEHSFDFIIFKGDWALVFCFLYKHVTFKPLVTFPNKVTFYTKWCSCGHYCYHVN